jgi:hypothetical protein
MIHTVHNMTSHTTCTSNLALIVKLIHVVCEASCVHIYVCMHMSMCTVHTGIVIFNIDIKKTLN